MMQTLSATIAAVGDICPGDHYFSLGHGAGSLDKHGRRRALQGLSPALQGADIAIANLEGVLSDTSDIDDPIESRVFRGSPDWAIALREAGFTALNVANNHSLQHGEKAFWNTVHSCRHAGLDVVGLAGDRELPTPVRIRVGRAEVVLLGASFVPDPRRPAGPTYAQPELPALAEQVRSMANPTARVVVSVHSGAEGLWLPDQQTVEASRVLASAGASAVLIHHSHVFQPVFDLGTTLVASGLGDCLFDLHWHPALTHAAVVKLTLRENDATEATLSPFHLTKDLEIQELLGRDRSRFLAGLALRSSAINGGRPNGHGALAQLEVRKLVYFLANLTRGDSFAKLRFLARKAARAVGRQA